MREQKPVLESLFPVTWRVYLYAVCVTAAGVLLLALLTGAWHDSPLSYLYGVVVVTLICTLPVVLTCVNLLGLKQGLVDPVCLRVNWLLTVVAGAFDSVLYAEMCDVVETATWDVQLYNSQLHQFIWTDALPTVVTLVAMGVCAFIVLACFRLEKLSPIVIVACIAALYIASAVLLTYSIQVMREAPLLALPAANCIVMAATLVQQKVREWNENPNHHVDEYDKNGLLNRLNRQLANSATWPVAGLIIALPLLGVTLAVLVLFGQRPDYVVRAWTETSDWTLSTKVAPVNLTYDEHYLCTVAATGHEQLVKPLRFGERHGHRIVVNRQLLVANAFENVLEEKVPRLHRGIRDFYDTYGFPLADHIRHSRVACDVTYLVMKPLEWMFLFVLYLVDANPENRIAVQYLPRQRRA